ncbi:MAG: helix-turn-helix domain-containing protein [Alphaproteobacteria bacterium]
MDRLIERPHAVIPTDQSIALATESSRALSKEPIKELRVQLSDGTPLVLPEEVKNLLYYMLIEMSRGNAVTVVPFHAELTTQEAADFLNVSRPYLINLLETNKIKYHKIGTHRRIRYSDLHLFKERQDEERNKARDELSAQAQELNLD